jgi:integrase
MRNAMMVQVQVDMRYLRPVGPKPRQRWEVQKIVPPKLQAALGKSTLTASTGIAVQRDEKGDPLPCPKAAAARDELLPQLNERIEAVRRRLESPRRVPVYHPSRLHLSNLSREAADRIQEVLRREFPGVSITKPGGFANSSLPRGAYARFGGREAVMLVEQPQDGSPPLWPGFTQPPLKVAEAHKVVPWSEGMIAWKAARRRNGVSTDAPTERRVQSKIDRLIKGLGYDDMSRPSTKDLQRYFDSFTEAAGTIKDHIIYVKAIYSASFDREVVKSNPAADISYNRNTGETGTPFTTKERAKIIAAARLLMQDLPEIAWPNLLAGFSGARIAEIAEANTRDVVWEEDEEGNRHLVFYIRVKRKRTVKKEGDRLRVKTRQSIRFFTIHTCIRDAFWSYVESLPPDSPLFPQFTLYPLRGGRRNKDASNKINRWLHDEVGIEEKSFHSWRHCIASALQGRKWAAWLTGHAGQSVREKVYLHPKLHEVAADIESLHDPATLNGAAK